MTEAQVYQAMRQLKQSDRGRRALASFMEWLQDAGYGLDWKNQNAMQTLLSAAFTDYARVVRAHDVLSQGDF